MHALALSLIVLASATTPPVAADDHGTDTNGTDTNSADTSGASTGSAITVALARPGSAGLNTGLALVGGGVALAAASIVGGMWRAADQAKLDDAADAFRQAPDADHARAIVDVRKAVGTNDVLALRSTINLALIASGGLTMTIGWVVAALGAAQLTSDDDAP